MVALHNNLPQDEVLWRVGDADGGGHASGTEVCLRLYPYGGRGLGRYIYLEYP